MTIHSAITLLHGTLGDALVWLRQNVLVWSSLAQLAAAAAALLLSHAVGRPLVRGLVPTIARLTVVPVRRVLAGLVEALPWLLLILLVWFEERAFEAAGTTPGLLRLVESLALAWIIIRVSSGLVRSPQLARLFASVAWILAALNIAGLIGPTVGLLGAMAFTIGTLRLSVLLLIKGALLLAVLIWAANLLSHVIESRLQGASEITPSVRVLASKLARATLLTLAVVVALSAVGIDLTAFAVFSGAIGVGVGFGLQKVVSNLISGVILLLDRSIKPGDVIEIGSTYGWITRLNARFVSVVTRDGTEYLIPNEDLITQQVVNWSYSNDLVRLHVGFGISYSADVHAAIRLAVDAAGGVARVLEEPVPVCLLTGLGDSAVDLELRFWIADPREGTANVKSDVLLRVWDAFHAAGIEFPFPQRDLTLRDPEGLARAFRAVLPPGR